MISLNPQGISVTSHMSHNSWFISGDCCEAVHIIIFLFATHHEIYSVEFSSCKLSGLSNVCSIKINARLSTPWISSDAPYPQGPSMRLRMTGPVSLLLI